MRRLLTMALSASLALTFFGCSPKTMVSETKPAEIKAAGYNDYEARSTIRDENPLEEAYIDAIRDFSVRCAAQTLSAQNENMSVSPLSLFLALSMATQGANGETKAEMLSAMGVSGETAGNLAMHTGNLIRRLHTDNEMGTLKLANSVWAQSGAPFEKEFLDNMSFRYYASVFNVDFADKATGEKAGKWIAENTGDLLKPEFQFDPATLMTLINTVYFKDQWVDEFKKEATKPDVFHKADGSEITCDFMNRENIMGSYIQGSGFTAAPLPLKNGGQMVFVLPSEGTSIDALLSDPNAVASMLDTRQASSGKVIYQVPKFRFGAAPNVKDAVRAMGVQKAFEADADFSGILKGTLFISNIIQQTHIGVDENGVEAAAFTAIMLAGAAMPQEVEPIMMVLDRPFIFAIISSTDVPLFMGVVNDPNAN